jgi:hypothetical protein
VEEEQVMEQLLIAQQQVTSAALRVVEDAHNIIVRETSVKTKDEMFDLLYALVTLDDARIALEKELGWGIERRA